MINDRMIRNRVPKPFQTVERYEDALQRHGQWVRWTRVLLCPCVNATTGQPDLQCTVCHGRGEIYKAPGIFHIKQEATNHDRLGRVYLRHTPAILSSVRLWTGPQSGYGPNLQTPVALDVTQPNPLTYIQMAEPYPEKHVRVLADYDFDPTISVTNEDAEVIATNVLRVNAGAFKDKGQTYRGSIKAVTRVFNVTRSLTYTVSLAQKEFIYLSAMTSWQSGDVLQVDYTYIEPFNFVIYGISPKRRFETAYVIDEAQATLLTPYWVETFPNDLFTSLTAVMQGQSVIDPSRQIGGPDEIRDFFDVAEVKNIVDRNGVEYDPATSVQLYGRNMLKWLVSKPTVNYTVHFSYNPTFVGLTTLDTARFAENKDFVSRLNLMMRDRMSREVSF